MALNASQKDPTSFLECISCHTFNKDRSQCALCPNNSSIEIYQTNGSDIATKWTKIHTLLEHSSLISDLDWNHDSGQLLSCSHDRTAYVWTLIDEHWKPELCVLRIHRAGLSCQWSPSGKKFAVTSGSKQIPICHYESGSDWWVSRIIKKHHSSIVDCCWSPNSRFLVTASTDYKCRIVSAYDTKLDERDNIYDSIFGEEQWEFGEVLAEYGQSDGSWVNCCAWSPNGKRLAFFDHNSNAHFIDLDKSKSDVQTVKADTLPMLKCVFIDDNTLIAAGFDHNPALYTNSSGEWKFKEFFEKEGDKKANTPATSSSMSIAFARFQAADSQGQHFGQLKKKSGFTTHQAQINCLKFDGKGTVFTTSGIDGRVQTWDAKKFM